MKSLLKSFIIMAFTFFTVTPLMAQNNTGSDILDYVKLMTLRNQSHWQYSYDIQVTPNIPIKINYTIYTNDWFSISTNEGGNYQQHVFSCFPTNGEQSVTVLSPSSGTINVTCQESWFYVMYSSPVYSLSYSQDNSYTVSNTSEYISGKVGIGIVPKEKLEVNGNAKVYGSVFTNEIHFTANDLGAGIDNTDPYTLRKVHDAYDGSHLELNLNDNPDESFRIYGNSSQGYNNGTYSGNLYHSFDASGNVYHAGNVGIGMRNPQSQLHVGGNTTSKFSLGTVSLSGNTGQALAAIQVGQASNGGVLNFQVNPWNQNGYTGVYTPITRMTIDQYGNVGIGSTTPPATSKLYVNGNIRANGDIYGSSVLTFRDDSRFSVTSATIPNLSTTPFSMPKYGIAAPIVNSTADLWIAGDNAIRMFTAGNATPRLTIDNVGNVGIGTTTPDQALTVKGKIHAEEVIVNLNVPMADYVFDPSYKLMPLNQVEQFAKTNSHLPEIPSAEEVRKNGINMGEMQNKLLQKVEELTLYMIEQQKTIDQQSAKIKELEKKIK